jgi:hypothetical protein
LLSEAYGKVLGADFLSTSLAFSLQFFSLPKASHTKRPKVKASSQYSKAKSPHKAPKGKSPSSFFRGLLYQQTGWHHGEWCDIVTEETCISASLNTA